MLVNYTVPHSTVNHRQRMGGQSPIGTGHGHGRVPQAEQAGSRSAGQQKSSSQQPVMILRGEGEGMGLEVHGWSRQKQVNVDITAIGRQTSHMDREQEETNIQDNTQQKAEAKH